LSYHLNVTEAVHFKGRFEMGKDTTIDLTIGDKIALKVLDKKEFEIKLKKKKMLFKKETLDSKKFKLGGLGN